MNAHQAALLGKAHRALKTAHLMPKEGDAGDAVNRSCYAAFYAPTARQQADYDAFTVFDEAAVANLITDVERFVQAVATRLDAWLPAREIPAVL